MSIHRRLSLFWIGWLLAAYLPIAQAQVVEAESWWEIDQEVGRLLIYEEVDLLEWTEAVCATPPTSAQEALIQLNVCVRSGLDDAACEALRSMQTFQPTGQSYEFSGIYHQLWDAYAAYPVALYLVETFAPQIHEVSLNNRLIGYYRDTLPEGVAWSDAFFEQWLADRVASVLAYDQAHPPSEDNPYRTYDLFMARQRPIYFWRRLQLQNLAKMGKAETLLDSLQAAALEEASVGSHLLAYLEALVVMKGVDREYQVELDWIEACRPERVTYQHRIAHQLMQLNEAQLAEIFYRSALETSLTDEEVRMLAGMRQAVIGAQLVRAHFQIRLREDLSECLLKLDRKDEAQEWMVQAADLRETHGLHLNFHFSGQVQGASGARVIEGRIQEAEEENLDDPQYWMSRAQYYRGRKHLVAEEDALRKGFALTQPGPKEKGKGQMNERRQFLSRLVRLLRKEKRSEEGTTLLLTEMEEAPIDSASSEAAARMFAMDVQHWIDPDEPILWDWLARRQVWNHTEERLLREMLERVGEEERVPYFDRAEQLVRGDEIDPSRARTLGWIFKYLKSPERAVAVLEYAFSLLIEAKDRQRCALTLMGAYLDLGDWKSAELHYADAEKRLTTREDIERLGDIAVVAAKAGDPDAAFRIWRRLANGSLKVKSINEELSALGLGDEIADYYEHVLERFPSANLKDVAPTSAAVAQ